VLQLNLFTKAMLVTAAVVAVALSQSVTADSATQLAVDNPAGTDLDGNVNLAVADVVTGGVQISEPTTATVTATVDPNSVGTSYYFEYGPNGNLTFRTPTVSLGASLDPRQVAADLLDLTPGTIYDYRIVTQGPGGDLSIGPVQRFSTGPAAGTSRKSSRCTIMGTARRDVLRGTRKRDVICGQGGNDAISGLGGNDVIRGGAGKDRALGGSGRDRMYGNSGNDALLGQGGNDRLSGGKGRDRLVGGPGRDSVIVQGRDKVRSAERISRHKS
jgi:Ca2+-binding RTX toxin-like protein